MRIESIHLTKQIFEDMGVGLPTIPMDPLRMWDLGQCVVLAGKNGSGKTRLLKLIEQISPKLLSPDERRQHEQDIARAQTAMEKDLAQIRLLEGDPQSREESSRLQTLRGNVSAYREDIAHRQKQLEAAHVFGAWGQGKPKIVQFVPRSTNLGDPSLLPEREATQLATTFAGSLAETGANDGAPAYARQTFRAAMAERGRRDGDPTGHSHQTLESSLLELLANLLGPDVQFELGDDLNLRLNGLPHEYSSLLSDGQKVLFQLACMLHARHASLKDCIVFMDEPENHLHPAVLNELVDRMLALLPEGQLWIATHSVPLIAHLVAQDPACLWFAEGGRFRPAGRTPETVLDSLLGGPDGAKRINELTLLPNRFASSLFLRQCLLPPGVVGYKEGDAQLQQIRDVLQGLRIDGRPLCVIDFGAGKGRLLDSVANDLGGAPLGEVIDYLAYEPDTQLAEQCQHLCHSLYGSADSMPRAFSSLVALGKVRGSKVADVAVVCNVLHEVHPAQWQGEFGDGSDLFELLRDDGFVLFVEDYALPVGERAHEYGFLLLDEEQLIALFDITEADVASKRFSRSAHPRENYHARLIAHLVSKDCLKRLTTRTTWNAIRSLRDQSLTKLKALLSQGGAPALQSAHGRESALVTQLAANSSLWLQDNQEIAS